MKGFAKTGKMPKSGFNFPEKFGFTSSSGKVQNVGGYTRRAPLRKATGGQVPGFAKEAGKPADMVYSGNATTIGDQGNCAELRTKPVTEFDKDHGGRGPLRPGFAMGGMVKNHMVPAMLGMSGPARAGIGQVPRVGLPRGLGSRPLMRAKGGKVGAAPRFEKGGPLPAPKPPVAAPKKAPPPPAPPKPTVFNKSARALADMGE